ncbi:MAG TPA: hypothetical protein VH120_06520 [Gemmataceae bacterium]|nr:hypothetical protein [Gemmataceae bacterium]
MTMRPALLLLRRFLVVAALMFWIGGFTFYAAVVVPIGTDVTGSKEGQGAITRQVAPEINWSGVAALTIFAVDIALTRSLRRWRRARWLAWLGMAVCLAALMAMYPHLDRMFHGEEAYLDDRSVFRPWHRAYLWTITVQWGFAILFAILSLAAWRCEDRLK